MGGKGSGRKPSPCGTPAKYQWHRKRGENCETCKAAHAANRRKRYKPSAAHRKGRKGQKVNARAHIMAEKLRRKQCMDCGWVVTLDNTCCFDFDHRDPTAKSFAVSSKVNDVSKERLDAEMNKCDLVCANCHRLRTKRQFQSNILTGTRLTRKPELWRPTLFDSIGLQ